MFQLIVLLNSEFNFCGSDVLFVVEGVATVNRLVSVIANVSAPVEMVITQFINQVSWRFISQLIKGISRVL